MSIPLGQPDRSSVLLKWSWLGLIIGEGRTPYAIPREASGPGECGLSLPSSRVRTEYSVGDGM